MKHITVSPLLLALALPFALVACAAPTDTETTASSSSELTILPVPLTLDPVSLCSGITADQTMTEPTFDPKIFAGTSDATRACDFSVFEVTGTLNQKLELNLTDLVPKSPAGTGAYPLGHPYTDITQAQCAASFVDYEAMGFVPPKWILVGQQIEYVPGKWEAIGTEQVVNGVWVTSSQADSSPHCAFAHVEDPNFFYDRAMVAGLQTTHSIVRVAVKAVIGTANGTIRGPLFVYATPE